MNDFYFETVTYCGRCWYGRQHRFRRQGRHDVFDGRNVVDVLLLQLGNNFVEEVVGFLFLAIQLFDAGVDRLFLLQQRQWQRFSSNVIEE